VGHGDAEEDHAYEEDREGEDEEQEQFGSMIGGAGGEPVAGGHDEVGDGIEFHKLAKERHGRDEDDGGGIHQEGHRHSDGAADVGVESADGDE